MEKTISAEESAKLKQLLLDMMAWFHDFCVEHELTYYAQGGTLLGAVRHQGFIPWDDDIDIGMPREDYLRLRELMKEHPHERFLLETPESEKADYYYPISKLYDSRTTLVENTRYKIKRGIFIDIFPLDGVGDTEEEAMCYFSSIKRRRQFLLTMTTGIRKGRSLYKNASVFLMRCIPDWIVSKKQCLLSLDRICGVKRFDDSVWVGNLFGNWMEREIMPKSIYGKPTPYTFENLTIFGAEDYDGYLTYLYGNWRELPPVEKRETHHDFQEINLNASYLL